jgi:hypothetical protein
MLWTERLFQLIPVGKESASFASFIKVRLLRSLCITFILFLVSVPAWLLMGITTTTHAYDALPLTGLLYLLAIIFIVLVVSGWFNKKWDWFFDWSSHILKLSETEFSKFRDRREKLVKSSSACLIITLVLFIIGVIPFLVLMNEEMGTLVLRPAVLIVYLAFTNFFICLLVGTLLWIIISMWITFYITLRQPLSLKLSPRTDEEFRPLAIWSLKVLFLAFVIVTIVVIFTNIGVVHTPGGVAGYASSLIFFVFMGVLAFLLPFYQVHRVLVKLKKQELHEIRQEHDRIINELSTKSTQSSDREAINDIINLEVLHVRERRAKDADDWPIDTTILSAVAGLVLIPILVNIITNLV